MVGFADYGGIKGSPRARGNATKPGRGTRASCGQVLGGLRDEHLIDHVDHTVAGADVEQGSNDAGVIRGGDCRRYSVNCGFDHTYPPLSMVIGFELFLLKTLFDQRRPSVTWYSRISVNRSCPRFRCCPGFDIEGCKRRIGRGEDGVLPVDRSRRRTRSGWHRRAAIKVLNSPESALTARAISTIVSPLGALSPFADTGAASKAIASRAARARVIIRRMR